MTAGWFNDLNLKLANIFSSGSNIGIGQSNPTAKLDVNGNGTFSGIVSANTPIAPNNLTTKAYVDAAVVSGAGGGGGSCYYTTAQQCGTGFERYPGDFSPYSGMYHHICCPSSGVVAIDPCSSHTPGVTCTGGGKYAFEMYGNFYMVTPGGCTDSSTPTCTNTTDVTTKMWSTENIHKTDSLNDGFSNTNFIIADGGGSKYPAAKYCSDMEYGGYSDWYLPATDELIQLYENSGSIGAFANDIYWSSTDGPGVNYLAQYQNMTYGPNQGYKNVAHYVRCIRKI